MFRCASRMKREPVEVARSVKAVGLNMVHIPALVFHFMGGFPEVWSGSHFNSWRHVVKVSLRRRTLRLWSNQREDIPLMLRSFRWKIRRTFLCSVHQLRAVRAGLHYVRNVKRSGNVPRSLGESTYCIPEITWNTCLRICGLLICTLLFPKPSCALGHMRWMGKGNKCYGSMWPSIAAR